ncbi:MAG: Gldg family protein [Lachnospiraceae bacterium]|nr:Gldg family protein [Lachnospiraceae bacterium]
MTAILFKELKSYFKSLFGWIFLAVFTFFEGAYFVANNIQYGSPYISDSLSPLIIVLIFILPLLTMRILAEEKRQKTDQFLITAPIPLASVIIGKFLALCTIMLMATAICSVGVGILAIYGNIPVVETICALAGFFLFGCQCIAVGMFLSSITEHQFLAAIFTYTVYIFTLIVPGFCQYIFGAEKVITKIVSITDIYAPFDGLMSGVLVLTDILYMISVIAIFLILAYKVFAKNSVQLSAMGKNRFFISNLLPFVIIAAIIGVNIGCSYIPTKYTEFDITKNGWYKITDESKKVLDTLNEDVTIYVISSEEEVDNTVKHYINSYDSYSKRVKVVYRPTSEYPEFAANFTNSALYYSSLIITMGDQFRVIDYYDMFEYSVDYSTYTQNITGIDVEGQITAAISSMIHGDNQVKIYCMSGHDELALPQYITDSLTKVGYSFTELYLYGKAVPDDCDILVINGPRSDLDTLDIESIKTYVNKGGKVIMTTATEDSKCTNYDEFIKWLGVEVTEGTVLEGDYRYMLSADDPTWILAVPEYSSPYTISDKKMNILCYARGLKYSYEDIPADTTITDIFVSSSSAYAKSVFSEAGISKEDGDEEGPFSLGVYLTKNNSATGETAEVVILGSGAFLYDQIDSIVSHGNSDLFIDASKKLVDNSLVTTIPVKELTYDQIVVSMSMVFFYVAVYCVIAPLAFIIAGFVILIIRRRK